MRTRGLGGLGLAVMVGLFVVAACGGTGSSGDVGGGGFDGSILVPTDTGGLVRPDGGGAVDVGRDVRVDPGEDVPATADVPPADVPPGQDVPPVPDIAEDVVDPCAACVGETPACLDGHCSCTADSCGAGLFCDDGACESCTVDGRCGPECRDCRVDGLKCARDGSACVVCDPLDPQPCPMGQYCAGGDCVACDTGAACGDDCAPCPADKPACVAGACTCDETSCPTGKWCFDGLCRTCNTALACGDACVDCRDVGTPNCIDGECRCLSDDHCPSDRWCEDGACLVCGADDPLHCGATCAVCEGATPVCVDGRCACTADADCGDGARCDAGGCVACDDGGHCGAECLPCPDEAPVCHEGACVTCVVDDDCAGGEWCNAGTCARCRENDPDHCGSACLDCDGAAPVCAAGQCVCDAETCPAGEACEGGVCVPCDRDDLCGPGCGACVAPAPRCAPDASGCVECVGDGDCTGGDVCRASNTCGPACEAPGCASDLGPDGKTCGAAKTVGRVDAIQTAFLSGDTDNDRNNDDLGSFETNFRSACWDASDDNFYRIWLRTGDRLDVVLAPMVTTFDSMLKLYRGTACHANGTDDLVDCYNPGDDGEEDSLGYTAPADGWVTIVVDGRQSSESDYGSYVLRVTLTCATEGCCCQ